MNQFKVSAITKIPMHHLSAPLADTHTIFEEAKHRVIQTLITEVIENKKDLPYFIEDDPIYRDKVVGIQLNVLTNDELETLLLEAEQRGRQDEARRTQAWFQSIPNPSNAGESSES
jgi:hypothetical protein